MTRDDILQMEAGPDMNAALAERVMGWQWRRSNGTGRRCLYGPDAWPEWMDQPADGSEDLVSDWDWMKEHRIPRYSTDIAAAWKVVERMKERGWPHMHYSQNGWTVGFVFGGLLDGTAPTAPLAICRAALLCTLEPTP